MDKDELIPVSNANLERISTTISLNCYIVVLLCLMSILITGVTLLLPGVVPVQKRVFVGLASLLGGCAVLVLICARRNPSALATWTWIAAATSSFLIGVSFMILAPHAIPTVQPMW